MLVRLILVPPCEDLSKIEFLQYEGSDKVGLARRKAKSHEMKALFSSYTALGTTAHLAPKTINSILDAQGCSYMLDPIACVTEA